LSKFLGEETLRDKDKKKSNSSNSRTAKHKAEIRRKRNKEEKLSRRKRTQEGRKREEDRRNKFFSRTPRAISQIAHRLKMVCMGAVGLHTPRTFRLLQIPT